VKNWNRYSKQNSRDGLPLEIFHLKSSAYSNYRHHTEFWVSRNWFESEAQASDGRRDPSPNMKEGEILIGRKFTIEKKKLIQGAQWFMRISWHVVDSPRPPPPKKFFFSPNWMEILPSFCPYFIRPKSLAMMSQELPLRSDLEVAKPLVLMDGVPINFPFRNDFRPEEGLGEQSPQSDWWE